MSERFISADAATVRAQIENLKAQYPELEEDVDLLRDMSEGETNLLDIISEAIDIKLDADEMVAAIKSREEASSMRKARFERKSEAMKVIIKSLMDAAGQNKLTLPQATISVTAAKEKVVVTNVDELPQGYFETEKRPKRDEISKALKAGEEVPGAKMETGKSGLTIRTK